MFSPRSTFRFSGKKRQKGISLMEMLLVVGLMMVIALGQVYQKAAEMNQQRARQIGHLLYQYNNAVRNWVSANPGTPNFTELGTAWLKDASCPGGTSPIAYLPCDFPAATPSDPIVFGKLYLQSAVSTTGVSPSEVTTVETTTSPFTITDLGGIPVVRSDLAGLAAIVAAAGSITNGSPLMAATEASYKSDPLTGIITMTTGNTPNNDAWLRTDGSNTMNNNLRFNSAIPSSAREIMNVARIKNIVGEVLSIGNVDGALSAEAVLVDADQTVKGALIVGNVAGYANGLEVADGNILARAGDIIASDNLRAGQNVYGKVFFDSDDTRFFTDPEGNSSLDTVSANVIRANPILGNDLTISSDELDLTHLDGTTTSPLPVTGHIDADNLLVRTRSGISVPLPDLLPNWVHKASWYARDGQAVGKPVCSSGGLPRVIVAPSTTPTNIDDTFISSNHQTPGRGATYHYATDFGTYWLIRVRSEFNNNPGVGAGIVQTYCMY